MLSAKIVCPRCTRTVTTKNYASHRTRPICLRGPQSLATYQEREMARRERDRLYQQRRRSETVAAIVGDAAATVDSTTVPDPARDGAADGNDEDDDVIIIENPAIAVADTDAECPVCLEQIEEPTSPPICNHLFCRVCIDHWISVRYRDGETPNCPLCRSVPQVQQRRRGRRR